MFALNSTVALLIIYVLKMLNIPFPGQISIISFDSPHLPVFFEPGLSYVEQDALQIGNIAALTLLKLMKGQKAIKSNKVPVKLVLKDSVKKWIENQIL